MQMESTSEGKARMDALSKRTPVVVVVLSSLCFFRLFCSFLSCFLSFWGSGFAVLVKHKSFGKTSPHPRTQTTTPNAPRSVLGIFVSEFRANEARQIATRQRRRLRLPLPPLQNRLDHHDEPLVVSPDGHTASPSSLLALKQ